MNFYNLQAIVGAKKVPFKMRAPTESFYTTSPREAAYIEPTFDKVEFNVEQPPVLLISAVGATGKSTLAHVLADRTELPLLDLAKHKPVGDNTLTGLLTTAFRVEDLSAIFQGLNTGTFGVIIDGVDEARSKTTEKGFEAFLDDLLRLSAGASRTCFVLLGRTQILEECWLYFETKGISAGLLTIRPFDVDNARAYIDAFAGGGGESQPKEYSEARDGILDRLGAAFGQGGDKGGHNFLSFIGYPPVLDAIVALLSEEKNYYRLQGELEGQDLNDVEISLIYRIVAYILKREREQKVVPNIVRPLLAGLPEREARKILDDVFDNEEQAFRLLSHCSKAPARLNAIPQPALNDQYETQLQGWIVEHPFVTGHEFRSTVFEAASVAMLLASGRVEYETLAIAYSESRKSNYHLIYLLHHIAAGNHIPLVCLRSVLGSAMEFYSTATSVEMHVATEEVENSRGAMPDGTVNIEVDVYANPDRESVKTFNFQSDLADVESVVLGPRLMSTYVSLPCDVALSGGPEIELTAPVEIQGRRLRIQGTSLVLRMLAGAKGDNRVLLGGNSLESTMTEIVTNGVDLTIALDDRRGVAYPAIQYVEDREAEINDPALKEKFLRLKRILVHFRSHSKGALAKYRHKIEHERVLGRESGPALLQRLLDDQILTRDGSFYFVEPAQVDPPVPIIRETTCPWRLV